MGINLLRVRPSANIHFGVTMGILILSRHVNTLVKFLMFVWFLSFLTFKK